MTTLFILLSFYSLTFALKESVLFDRPRAALIRLHPLFYSLFSCYFCVGFWSGIIVYFFANNIREFNLFDLILWGLASAATSYITDIIVSRINKSNV